MKKIERYSKITIGNDEKAVGVIYFDDLYKAEVLVDLKSISFYINEMVNFPNTNYSSYDEIINNTAKSLGINTRTTATSITKDEFHEILKDHDLRNDFIMKIKEKFPEEIIRNMLD